MEWRGDPWLGATFFDSGDWLNDKARFVGFCCQTPVHLTLANPTGEGHHARRPCLPPMDLIYSFDPAKLDFATIHRWLSGTYWSPGIDRQRVEKGFHASTLVIGCYTANGDQIGVARCLSDTTRFAYFADVFVAEEWRGKGIARSMVGRLIVHPDLAGVDNQFLFTQDAHGVYERLGFGTYAHPERLMHRCKTD